MNHERHEQILNSIDDTLAYENSLDTFEDRLISGLERGIQLGIMTQQEADEYLFAYLQSRNLGAGDYTPQPRQSLLLRQEQPVDPKD